MRVCFCHFDTGTIMDSTFSADIADETLWLKVLEANTPADHIAVEGCYDSQSQRVDLNRVAAQREAHVAAHAARVSAMRAKFVPLSSTTGSPVEFVEPRQPMFVASADVVVDYEPPQPSDDHEWDAGAKRWRLGALATARIGKRAAAVSRIAVLEAAQHRPLRELARDPNNAAARARIDVIDAEISQLRTAL